MKVSKERIATLALGHVGNFLFGKCIDWGLDPLVAFLLFSHVGGIKGFLLTWITLSIISLVVCYATLVFYDWSKTDWLGIETIKTLKELEGSKFKLMVAKMVRKGDIFAVIALSIITDSFIVIAYMRHGKNQYNGLTERDWEIFLVSVLISNGWWTILMYGGLSGIKEALRIFV